ncbi:probable WRKY transcription factor 23 [Olea europaea var. sylvestris]|uniref:probable WRKY transcription factor 23 n=1 Tax=Olea europaea var. sylvestris TaxID=158386 RepID=UPI000C1D5BB8|nr:probable WRKY transcription factor 23 [Olea europaea var. sylvestris]
MEDLIQLASNYSLSGLMDYSAEGEKSSLGFMELLNMQDFGPSFLDILQVPSEPFVQTQTPTVFQESSEVVNIPNDSSISSESCGGPNDEQNKEVLYGEGEEEHKAKKQLKPNKKRQREPRFAFMTRSEVDHLEDGYRWRKYGQKTVKNSPFPRSYYRCTTASCNVKKRVERSYHDPSTVVTTYEGQDTHPSPVIARPNPAVALASDPAFFSGGATAFSRPAQTPISYYNYSTAANYPSTLLRDIGLLQDIMPSSIIRKEE